jgi:hypothetical protein
LALLIGHAARMRDVGLSPQERSEGGVPTGIFVEHVTMVGTRSPLRYARLAHPTEIPISFAETAARQFRYIAAPIRRQKSPRDVAVKGTMRPIASARDQPMFHRIEMNVIDVAREVGIVADGVLPKAALPYAFFASADFTPASLRIGRETAGEIVLYQAPAAGKIRVVGREGPNRVQVIGQDADRNRLEGVTSACSRVSAAKPLDVPHEEAGRTVGESHSEEEPTAFDPSS